MSDVDVVKHIWHNDFNQLG